LPDAIPSVTATLLGWLAALGIALPDLSEEGVAALSGYTYWGSAEKAKRELGWRVRPVEETFRETLEWLRGNR
jgi:nucleoside-diphosphate-sugar epimerase